MSEHMIELTMPRSEYRAWMNSVKAEALRGAAEVMCATKGYDIFGEGGEHDHIGKDNAGLVRDWLLERADQIEAGDT